MDSSSKREPGASSSQARAQQHKAGGENQATLLKLRWLWVFVSLLVSLLSMSIIECQVHSIKDINKYSYAIVIDCGSSGSRLTIFHWDASLRFPDYLNDIKALRDKANKPITERTKGGVAKLEDFSRERVEAHFGPIANTILKYLTPDQRESAGLFVLGTAGMRLLDEDARERLIQEIRSIFDDTNVKKGFVEREKFGFVKVKVEVISGAQEGMYTWLTVNQLEGSIHIDDASYEVAAAAAKAARSKDERISLTKGVIEMGGASVQVTYEVEDEVEDDIRHRMGVNEAQSSYTRAEMVPAISRASGKPRLKSTTFLGLGSNSARDNYVDILIKQEIQSLQQSFFKRTISQLRHKFMANHVTYGLLPKNAMRIEDPCLPKEFDSDEHIRPRSILSLDNDRKIGYVNDLAGLSDNDKFRVSFRGTGNYKKCEQNLIRLIDTFKETKMTSDASYKDATNSLLKSGFVPFDSMHFIGIGEFYYTTNTMLDSDGDWDAEKIERKTKKICQTPYPNLQHEYPRANDHDTTRLQMECFKAVYIQVLLKHGLNMGQDVPHFKTMMSSKGYKIDWALGAAIDRSDLVVQSIGNRVAMKMFGH